LVQLEVAQLLAVLAKPMVEIQFYLPQVLVLQLATLLL